MRKIFGGFFLSLKSQPLSARCPMLGPMLNPDASPHANRLAQPPHFSEIFEEDDVGTRRLLLSKPNTRNTPQDVTLYVVCIATHVLARTSSLTPPSFRRRS
jgi:hypothetical protein